MSAAAERHARRAQGRIGRAPGRLLLLATIGLVAALAVGCIPSTYEYPVDFFNEMHYQQYYRAQEPPSLSPPEGAVPRVGAEPVLSSAALAQATNPLQRSPETLAAARRLYDRNCVYCHGAQGKGDGIIAGYFRSYNAPVPASFDSQAVVSQSDGQLFATITNGRRDEATLVGMPAFRNMTTEQERWLMVLQIRAFQQPQ